MRRPTTMLAAGAVLAIALAGSGIGVAEEHDEDPVDERAVSEIFAQPLIKLSDPGNFNPTAVLTAEGGEEPIVGATVSFKTPGPLGTEFCSDTTDADGVASCDDPNTYFQPVLQGGQGTYVAEFGGDDDYQGSSARSGIVGT